LDYKEGIYLGKEVKDVYLSSKDPQFLTKFYLNSALANHAYPSQKTGGDQAEIEELVHLKHPIKALLEN
tara:strand:+ start:288 stop:494 length:207 start_codon:yes stop_codon:yes gene_type:complete